MSTGTVTLLVLALVIIAVVAGLASTIAHHRATRRRQVGPEFDRLARETGPRRARAEFTARRKRVDGLGIKPLTEERRSRYLRQWAAAQERFIDSPPQAAAQAAALVTAVAAERGYDVSDHERLLADLSVYHGQYLDAYRRATRTTERPAAAATEELRRALLDHRALFQDLLGAATPPDKGRLTTAGQPAARARRSPWRPAVPALHRGRRADGDKVRDGGGVAAARS